MANIMPGPFEAAATRLAPMKMPEPMTVPTTTVVAVNSLSSRRRPASPIRSAILILRGDRAQDVVEDLKRPDVAQGLAKVAFELDLAGEDGLRGRQDALVDLGVRLVGAGGLELVGLLGDR